MDETKSLRKSVGALARRAGLDRPVKSALLAVHRMAEAASFATSGRPAPSDAIVLAGSGRSGTTWLADLLTERGRIQQIFEPLNPAQLPEAARLSGWESPHRNHISSVYLPASEPSPQWEDFLGRALTGRVRSWWTESGRTTLFPVGFLVKVIRANLMLGFIHDAFRPKIVLQLRHPCAVVASRMRASWHADVEDILRQDKLVDRYLKPFVDEMRRERDELGAHAVWWAVEHAVALQELESRSHLRVFYEKLVMDPERELHAIQDWLGAAPRVPRRDLVDRPSRTTHPTRQQSAPREQISSWREQLSEHDQRRILGWAHRLGVDCYGEDTLPAVKGGS